MTVRAERQPTSQEPSEAQTAPNSTVLATACTSCGSTKLRSVVEVPNVPAFCNVLVNSAIAAKSVRRGDIQLVYCEECTYLFNAAFDASVLAYSPEYANSLSCSPSFGSFLQEMSVRLVDKHGLNEKTVLELGSGDGDFLKRLSTIGHNRGFGFDPSYSGPGHVDDGNGVTFEASYYTPADSVNPDLVCSRHVLEHVEEPLEFMRLLATAADKPDSGVYVEVPNANYMLEKPAVWDLIYEHPGYFTDRSLVSVTERAGLQVTEVRPTFSDQFLYVDALNSNSASGSFLDQTTDAATLGKLASDFRGVVEKTVARWTDEIRQLADDGKRVVTWGAGSKGVTFLNLVDSSSIEYIVDINPEKHGRYVPGSGQSAVGPEMLVDYQPDLILLMNGAYETEVNDLVQGLNVNARVKVVD